MRVLSYLYFLQAYCREYHARSLAETVFLMGYQLHDTTKKWRKTCNPMKIYVFFMNFLVKYDQGHGGEVDAFLDDLHAALSLSGTHTFARTQNNKTKCYSKYR